MPESLPLSYDDVCRAAERLRGIAKHTPVMTSRTLDATIGRQVFFKCENFQRSGAFKFRGAYNRLSLLTDDEKQHGIVAYSTGNHAQATALAAKLLSIPATVVLPDDVPAVKLAAARGYGAEVVFYDRFTGSREETAQKLSEERGLTIIPPSNDPRVFAGQGTAARELLEEVPDLDVIVVPIGGGGLISGTCIAAKTMSPSIRVYGVEPEGADDAKQSLEQGKIVRIAPPTTIADGIRTQALGMNAFAVMQKQVDDVAIVSDSEIIEATRFLLLRMKLVAEPTGAVPLAAVMRNRLPAHLKRVGIIVSGGNIDPDVLRQVVS